METSHGIVIHVDFFKKKSFLKLDYCYLVDFFGGKLFNCLPGVA